MRKSAVVLVTLALCASVVPSAAFDGQRKGFVLGGGLGGGAAHLKQTFSDGQDALEGERDAYGSLVTDFRIGGAFNNQWMLYYDNQIWWFNTENALGNSETFIFGIGLVGLSYYFKTESPSLYAVATIGIAQFGTSDNYSDSNSFGISGGLGYEFARHWSIEAVAGYGAPEETSSGVTLETEGVVWAIRFIGMAY